MVNNKKDVYRVFADKLHDLKKMMRRNHIKLKRKNFETAMVKASAFYDQLTH
jgi:CMP-N-acetylneuraminic acid synthetase